jgi:hypothetical protein
MYLYSFILSFLLIGCAGSPFLHKGNPVKPKAQKIKFNCTDETECFQKLKKVAVKDGYIIESQDKDTKSFATDFKHMSDLKWSDASTDVQIKVSIIDSVAILTGNARQGESIGGASLGAIPAMAYGQEGSIMRNGWNELYRFATTQSSDLIFE